MPPSPDERKRRFLNLGNLAGLGVLFALLVVRAYDPFPMESLRLGAFDFYQRLQPRELPATRPVIIVAVDEISLKAVGQWPWPRDVVARLTDILAAAGPSVVVYDALFAEPDRMNPGEVSRSLPALPDAARRSLEANRDNDQLFAEAMEKIPVVLGVAGHWEETGNERRQPLKKTVAVFGRNARRFMPMLTSLVRTIPVLEKAAQGHGLLSLLPNHDSITRRMPTVFAVHDRVYPSLAAETLRVALREELIAFSVGDSGSVSISIGKDLVITGDRYGRIWPHFAHSRADLYVSAADVLAGKVKDNRFKGKIVLVGTTAAGLGDIKATPISPAIPGVEIHAQTIESALTKTLLERPAYVDAAELSLVLVTGLCLIVGTAATPVRWSLAVFLALGGTVGTLSWLLFSGSRFLLDPVFPIIALVVLYVTCLFGRSVTVDRKARDRAGG